MTNGFDLFAKMLCLVGILIVVSTTLDHFVGWGWPGIMTLSWVYDMLFGDELIVLGLFVRKVLGDDEKKSRKKKKI